MNNNHNLQTQSPWNPVRLISVESGFWTRLLVMVLLWMLMVELDCLDPDGGETSSKRLASWDGLGGLSELAFILDLRRTGLRLRPG
jgi:hypothetical protein